MKATLDTMGSIIEWVLADNSTAVITKEELFDAYTLAVGRMNQIILSKER